MRLVLIGICGIMIFVLLESATAEQCLLASSWVGRSLQGLTLHLKTMSFGFLCSQLPFWLYAQHVLLGFLNPLVEKPLPPLRTVDRAPGLAEELLRIFGAQKLNLPGAGDSVGLIFLTLA